MATDQRVEFGALELCQRHGRIGERTHGKIDAWCFHAQQTGQFRHQDEVAAMLMRLRAVAGSKP